MFQLTTFSITSTNDNLLDLSFAHIGILNCSEQISRELQLAAQGLIVQVKSSHAGDAKDQEEHGQSAFAGLEGHLLKLKLVLLLLLKISRLSGPRALLVGRQIVLVDLLLVFLQEQLVLRVQLPELVLQLRIVDWKGGLRPLKP